MSTVLVTGGSGFIASHTILQLLEAGHTVRATVRNLAKEGEVRTMLERGGMKPDAPLTFFAADLGKEDGWAEAARGCDYVQHIASPFPPDQPKNEDELIIPAREGALRVLRAARDAGVKRVVLTSSFAAVGYGIPVNKKLPFDETDWSNPNGKGVSPYGKSKTLAERAAWQFMEREGGRLELAVVNPVGVLGPVLGPDFSTSILLVQRLLQGAVSACPKSYFGLVDVRDVADLHIRAMTDPKAKGQRFLAVAGETVGIIDIARVLKANLGDVAAKVPTREAPNWLIRLVAPFNPTAKALLPQLGVKRHASGEKARKMLGWSPRSNEEAIMATAESLMRLGLV